MALPTDRQPGDVISAADVNAIATTINTNENNIVTLTSQLGDKADANHTHDASQVVSGTVAVSRLPTSSTSARGVVELATVAEAQAGTDATRAVTPQGLMAVADTKPDRDSVIDALNGKANVSHQHSVSDLTAEGTRNTQTYLRGDNTWSNPLGTWASSENPYAIDPEYLDSTGQDEGKTLVADGNGGTVWGESASQGLLRYVDPAFKPGITQRGFVLPGRLIMNTLQTAKDFVEDVIYGQAFYIERPMELTMASIRVVTPSEAGGVCRLGIYRVNDDLSQDLVSDLGTVSLEVASDGVRVTLATPLVLAPGTYLATWFLSKGAKLGVRTYAGTPMGTQQLSEWHPVNQGQRTYSYMYKILSYGALPAVGELAGGTSLGGIDYWSQSAVLLAVRYV